MKTVSAVDETKDALKSAADSFKPTCFGSVDARHIFNTFSLFEVGRIVTAVDVGRL